jgi:predicted  nucleic acid-binding Zn-ribbon protein
VDLTPNDIAELRLTADKAAGTFFDQSKRLHALLDAYEAWEAAGGVDLTPELAEANERIDAKDSKLSRAITLARSLRDEAARIDTKVRPLKSLEDRARQLVDLLDETYAL